MLQCSVESWVWLRGREERREEEQRMGRGKWRGGGEGKGEDIGVEMFQFSEQISVDSTPCSFSIHLTS